MSVITGTKENAEVLAQRRMKDGQNIVVPAYFNIKTKIMFKSDRELLTVLIDNRIQSKSIIINYKNNVDEIDRIIAKIATNNNIEYIILSPNGSQFSDLPQIEVAENTDAINRVIFEEEVNIIKIIKKEASTKELSSKKALLIITPSRLVTATVINDLKQNVKNISLLLNTSIFVTNNLTDAIYRNLYASATVVVYEEVDIKNYQGLTYPYKRTRNELAIFSTFVRKSGKFYIIGSKGLPSKITKRDYRKVILPDVFDATLTLLIASTSKKNVVREDIKEIMYSLGVIDSSQRVTNIGTEIHKYSNNMFAALFYYYWIITQKDIKFYYPGLVITSFLEISPIIKPNIKSVTSLHDFVNFWVAMTENKLYDPDPKTIDSYLSWNDKKSYKGPRLQNEDLRSLLISLNKKMARYTVRVFGAFTAEGVISRSIPLLNIVYESFSSKRVKKSGSFLMGEEYIDMSNYPLAKDHYRRLAIIDRYWDNDGNALAYVVLPMADKPTQENFVDNSDLPPLTSTVPITRTKIITIEQLPFVNYVGSLAVK